MAPIASLLVASALLIAPAHCRRLFKYEQQQLTREDVALLPEEDAQLFAFEDQFIDAEQNSTDRRCRYDPTHAKWPSEKGWNKLRAALSSKDALIATVPQASVCYAPTENAAQCQQLTSNWTNSYAQMSDPAEVLSPVYQGLTCQPPSIYNSGNCTIGGYPAYVIKAATVSDVQFGVNFARNDYIRLVVKNTGHDFAGKSAGYGALSIWTHGFKDMEYIENYQDGSGYVGPAIKAGAGVQAFELYKFANDKGVMAVGGEGQTVGIFGGYIQGGGHSPLSSIYGMASDHALSFELVTPTGSFVTANTASNPDLFWALRGGGGSTFGVVTSVTIKVYKDMPVATARWTLDSAKLGVDAFWFAAKTFFDRAIDNVNNGTYSYWSMSRIGDTFSMSMHPVFAPNMTSTQLNALLLPYFSRLAANNIALSPKITSYTSFYSAWQSEFPLEGAMDTGSAVASRLFPRSNFASETGRNLTFAALKQAVENGLPLIAFNMAPKGLLGSPPDSAVNPAWRTAVYHIITARRIAPSLSVAEKMSVRTALTNGTMAQWRNVSPSSGAYLNEADRLEPNWQASFWGTAYERLLGIKRDVDPRDVFWANRAVGSEGWAVETFDGGVGENGRLCVVG